MVVTMKTILSINIIPALVLGMYSDSLNIFVTVDRHSPNIFSPILNPTGAYVPVNDMQYVLTQFCDIKNGRNTCLGKDI